VIYLHGRIIEDGDRRPTHPQWGTYEFEQVLDALTAEGAVVIGEQRPPSADMELFAHHVAGQVEQLLRAGVPPERVAVVGFSKGGGIAMRASALLENPRVTMVLLAACGDGDFSTSDIRVWGRVLSVYEASDDSGRSCGVAVREVRGDRRALRNRDRYRRGARRLLPPESTVGGRRCSSGFATEGVTSSQSPRSAVTGSTCAASYAGRRTAAMSTSASASSADVHDHGSIASTPYRAACGFSR
jgi:hypothetical protein